jgi:hypothetical protein
VPLTRTPRLLGPVGPLPPRSRIPFPFPARPRDRPLVESTVPGRHTPEATTSTAYSHRGRRAYLCPTRRPGHENLCKSCCAVILEECAHLFIAAARVEGVRREPDSCTSTTKIGLPKA